MHDRGPSWKGRVGKRLEAAGSVEKRLRGDQCFPNSKRELGNYLHHSTQSYEVWVPVFVPSSKYSRVILSSSQSLFLSALLICRVGQDAHKYSEQQSSTSTRSAESGKNLEGAKATDCSFSTSTEEAAAAGRLQKSCSASQFQQELKWISWIQGEGRRGKNICWTSWAL